MGVNSGLDPFGLTNKQLGFAVNSTVRGNFITNRPAYQLMEMVVPEGSDLTTLLASGIFQGANYCAPDIGPQQLVAQIGGRLLTFTPDVNDTLVPVVEVSIPGDLNSSNLPVAWLKQAERWIIVDNGSANPIFYDTGSGTSRRSISDKTLLGISDITSQPFTPSIGSQMTITLSAPYTGPVNQAVQLVEYDTNGTVTQATNYAVLSVGGAVTSYNLTLKQLGDAPGKLLPVNAGVNIAPALIGNNIQFNIFVPGAGVPGVDVGVLTLSYKAPVFVVFGTRITVGGSAGWSVSSISADRKTLNMAHANNGENFLGEITKYSPVAISGNNTPETTIGNLSASFNAPGTGAVVTVTLKNPFTYAIGQLVYINDRQYMVTQYEAVTMPTSPNDIQLQNLNDSRSSHQFNTPTTTPTKIYNFPELPPGRQLTYGQNRITQAQPNGISFIVGDQVGGPSGSPFYQFRDAVLKVSENDLLANGGFFPVPSNLGQISAICVTSQLDASLGQGPVMVVCPGGVFSCNLPSDRTIWNTLTTPIVADSLIGFGGLSQNSTIVVNGDLMFRAVDGIRSLIMARREFWSWGNAPISFEMNRIIAQDTVTLLPYVSAVQFDNRMLMSCAPLNGPQGVYSQGLIALNFDPVSTLQGKGASVYDGLWTGLNVLQMIEGQFNGVHRCFAFTYSTTEKTIQLYEILKGSQGNYDNGDKPITWSFETPVLYRDPNTKGYYDLCSLEDGEFYVRDVVPGTQIDFKVEFRPDFSACWFPWHEFPYCNAPGSNAPIYGDRLGLGKPYTMLPNKVNYSNANFAHWFQLRFTINGHCTIMGMHISAARQPESRYALVIPKPNGYVAKTVYYENGLVSSGILCREGTLAFGGSLPRWITLIGNQLLGARGTFTGISQEAANEAAKTALCDFIAKNQSSFDCG